MKTFFTGSTSHLKKFFSDLGTYNTGKYCDSEIFLNIKDVPDRALVIASTYGSSDNFIELLFLLDALSRGDSKVDLLFTYFAYSRQDRIVNPGDVLSAQVVSNCLQQFNLNKIYILHPHSLKLHSYINFESLYLYKLFESLSLEFDVIISPDIGGLPLVQEIASRAGKEYFFIEKVRDGSGLKFINTHSLSVKNKKCIILDDIISTGSTLLQCAKILKESGAQSISVAATHALFCKKAKELVKSEIIENIFVTNSVKSAIRNNKIKIFNIFDYISNFNL